MKKIIIVCGLISGLIVTAVMLVSMTMCGQDINYENGMIYGFGSMILAFSLIFVGIKNYRDKYNNGVISFGKAFKIGFFISLIASTMYVIAWAIDYNFFIPDFMDKYAALSIEKLKAAKASTEDINNQAKEMADMKVMYKNPFFFIVMTYAEILPVGLLITLISAAILKRK